MIEGGREQTLRGVDAIEGISSDRVWSGPDSLRGLVLGVVLLSVLLFMSSGYCVAGTAEPLPNRPLLKQLRVTSLLDERLIDCAVSDSLLRVLFHRTGFVAGEPSEGGQGISGGFYEITNPFEAPTRAIDESLSVSIDVTLEQATYGPASTFKKDLIAFWAFGLLGALIAGQTDVVAGSVEWRAIVHVPRLQQPLVFIGQGLSAGPIATLDRTNALISANRRALWGLASSVARGLNESLALRLKRKAVKLDEGEFRRIVDDW